MFDIRLSSPLLRGLLIASVLTPFLISLWIGSRVSLSPKFEMSLGFCMFCFIFGTWASLFVFLLFGTPVLLILQHFRATSFWVFCLVGGVTAAMLMVLDVLLDILLRGRSSFSQISIARDLLRLFLLGAFNGFVIWLVAKLRSNRQLQRTRASGASRPSHGPLN